MVNVLHYVTYRYVCRYCSHRYNHGRRRRSLADIFCGDFVLCAADGNEFRNQYMNRNKLFYSRREDMPVLVRAAVGIAT